MNFSAPPQPLPSGPQAPPPNSNALVFDHVEEMSGWGSCSAPSCAGGRGQAPYNMTQTQSYTIFSIGNGSFSNALWWKKFGPYSSTSNFIWDFDVAVDNNSVTASALEFDLFQSVGGRKYMFGSQCNYITGSWQGWNDTTTSWVNIPVTCSKFSPNQWHHVQWYFQRNPSNLTTHYISLTIDGTVFQVNASYPSSSTSWADTLGLQFQLDTGGSGTGLSEAVTNVRVQAW